MPQSTIERLQALMKDVTEQPEKLFEVMTALTEEVELTGDQSAIESLRRSTRAVGNMIGMEADSAWRRLPWLERFHNRKRQEEWKQECTAALHEDGRRLVAEVRAGRR